jgi:hypothetical protein
MNFIHRMVNYGMKRLFVYAIVNIIIIILLPLHLLLPIIIALALLLLHQQIIHLNITIIVILTRSLITARGNNHKLCLQQQQLKYLFKQQQPK